MSRQRLIANKEIDILTPEEAAEIFAQPYSRVVLSLGGSDSIEEIRDDLPTKGVRTISTSFRRGTGSDNFNTGVAVFKQLCDFRQGRLAGTIQNIGSNPCLVYLAPLAFLQAQVQGAIQGCIVGFLAANGGNFDFKLTNDCWGGPVCVFSTLGTTLVWGEH